ncbi:MAG: hypothetical protein OEV68_09570, partial [candidate division Zixibacteria bacterium]|nr:hypothetical protein [candidate division Zixibacteria bacterium]
MSVRQPTLSPRSIVSITLTLGILFAASGLQVFGQTELTLDTTLIVDSAVVEAAPVTSLLVEDGVYDNGDSVRLF